MKKRRVYRDKFLIHAVEAVDRGLLDRDLRPTGSILASVGRIGTPSHAFFLVDAYDACQIPVINCRDSRDLTRFRRKLKKASQ